MKNVLINKDKWYNLINLNENYFHSNFIKWDPDGSHDKDHLLQQSHMKNFGTI